MLITLMTLFLTTATIKTISPLPLQPTQHIECIRADGNIYAFTSSDKNYNQNDKVILIMDNKGTENPTDDIIYEVININ